MSPELARAIREDAVIHVSQALICDFADGQQRYVARAVDVTAGGQIYRATGGFLAWTVSDLAGDFVASKGEVTLAGLPENGSGLYLKTIAADPALYRGRRVQFGLLFFAGGAPLDLFIAWSGVMDSLVFRESVGARSVALSCETPFATKQRPRHNLFTDADQRARFPGDSFLEFNSAEIARVIQGPVDVD